MLRRRIYVCELINLFVASVQDRYAGVVFKGIVVVRGGVGGGKGEGRGTQGRIAAGNEVLLIIFVGSEGGGRVV